MPHPAWPSDHDSVLDRREFLGGIEAIVSAQEAARPAAVAGVAICERDLMADQNPRATPTTEPCMTVSKSNLSFHRLSCSRSDGNDALSTIDSTGGLAGCEASVTVWRIVGS